MSCCCINKNGLDLTSKSRKHMTCCLTLTVCVTVESCCSLISPWWCVSRPQSVLHRVLASDDTCSRHRSTFQLPVSSDFRLSQSGFCSSGRIWGRTGSNIWGIIPPAGETGRRRLSKLTCSGTRGYHGPAQFSPPSAIKHEEDRSIIPGTCLIQSSPRDPSDCRLHTFRLRHKLQEKKLKNDNENGSDCLL